MLLTVLISGNALKLISGCVVVSYGFPVHIFQHKAVVLKLLRLNRRFTRINAAGRTRLDNT